jgi:IclR family pca regulon transcriptional regulator
LLSTAQPLIDDVSETFKITTELAFYEEDTAAILYRRDASEAFVPRFPISRRREQFYLSAIGKAILSHLSKNEIDALLANIELMPKTENTITDKDALAEELKLTKKRGYALNNEEWVPGLIAIAAPVLDNYAGKAIGAVCFDFSTTNNSIAQIEDKFADVVIKLANNISRLVEIHGK